MTAEELKKLDKMIRDIPYPYRENFPSLKKMLRDISDQQDVPVSSVVQQYLAWKWSK